MKEYRVNFARMPTAYNPWRVLFVQAATAEDAEEVAREHLERTEGFSMLKFRDIEEVKPRTPGRVIGGA